MSTLSVPQPARKRRRFSRDFKARIVAACQQPGVSVSRIALDNGLNANMVRRWIKEAKRTVPAFVPVALPTPSEPIESTPAGCHIRIEIPRVSGPVVVEWPADQAHQCLALLRELLA